MDADDIAYFSKVSSLMDELQKHEREILKLATEAGNETFDIPKLRKMSEKLFRLWEAAVHHNLASKRLKDLDNERWKFKKGL